MSLKTLYHGSSIVIEKPEYGKGNKNNDYGFGFYCTENLDLAKEWACSDNNGGYANIYIMDTLKLNILNLSSNEYIILNWLAILIKNRTFKLSNQIAIRAKAYILENFLIDIKQYDVIIGYRADDSYFSFAQDFLNNTISLRQLEKAMYFGKLGEQFVLKSKKAFDIISFEGSEFVEGEIYYAKRISRDGQAKNTYLQGERNSLSFREDLFMLDILRQEMKYNDARLQRKLFE